MLKYLHNDADDDADDDDDAAAAADDDPVMTIARLFLRSSRANNGNDNDNTDKILKVKRNICCNL